jgi:hypothetical protein
VLFFTAGIAFLTLIINATTCPTLVRKLGIARSPWAKRKVLLDIVARLEEKREDASTAQKCALEHVLHHVKQELRGKSRPSLSRQVTSKTLEMFMEEDVYLKPGWVIVEEYKAIKEAASFVPEVNKELLAYNKESPTSQQEASLIQIVLNGEPDTAMTRTISESFLSLVRASLWTQIQRGDFVPGSRSVDALLSSNSKAIHSAGQGLTDFECLEAQLGIHEKVQTARRRSSRGVPQTDESQAVVRYNSNVFSNMGLQIDYDENDMTCRSRAKRFIEGAFFQGLILTVICLNAVVIFLDTGPDSDDAMAYTAIDCVFLSVYIAELIVKLLILRRRYFLDGWNALDFICVVLGIFGVLTTVLVEVGAVSANAISSEMLLIRLGRVFKILRMTRLVVIVKIIRRIKATVKKESVSPSLAEHLKLIFALRGFIQAHLESHHKFLKYFGTESQRCACGSRIMSDSEFCRKCGAKRPPDMVRHSLVTGCEHARCILESWIAVYHAAIVASYECSKADAYGHWILEGLEGLRQTTEVTELLANFVVEAAEDGVILYKDAEDLIHPMHAHLKVTEFMVRDTHDGIHRNTLKKQCNGDVRRTGLENNVVDEDDVSTRSTYTQADKDYQVADKEDETKIPDERVVLAIRDSSKNHIVDIDKLVEIFPRTYTKSTESINTEDLHVELTSSQDTVDFFNDNVFGSITSLGRKDMEIADEGGLSKILPLSRPRWNVSHASDDGEQNRTADEGDVKEKSKTTEKPGASDADTELSSVLIGA